MYAPIKEPISKERSRHLQSAKCGVSKTSFTNICRTINLVATKINCSLSLTQSILESIEFTGMAPNSVSTKNNLFLTNLVSLTAQQLNKLVKKPSLKPQDRVQIAKEDVPLKKHRNKASLTGSFGLPKVQRSTYLLRLSLTEKTFRRNSKSKS